MSTVFMAVGVSDIVAQGLLLPHLIRWLGDKGVSQLGLGLGVLAMIGLALVPVTGSAALLYLSVVVFASGEGVFNATLASMLSAAVPDEAQGRVQGGSQAFQSLAQVAGPLAAGTLYGRLGGAPTFAAGAVVVLLALGVLTGSRTTGGAEGQNAAA